jgi:hypothetical protein
LIAWVVAIEDQNRVNPPEKNLKLPVGITGGNFDITWFFPVELNSSEDKKINFYKSILA